MARMHLKPRLIFDRCVDFLIQRRVQVPSAHRLNDLIRASLHERKAELIALMDINCLPRRGTFLMTCSRHRMLRTATA